MTTVNRLLVILIVTAIVTGLVFLIGTSGWADQFVPSGQEAHNDSGEGEDGEGQGRGQGGEGRGQHRGSGGGSGQSGDSHAEGIDLLESRAFLKTLIPWAVIIPAVVLFRKGIAALRKRKTKKKQA